MQQPALRHILSFLHITLHISLDSTSQTCQHFSSFIFILYLFQGILYGLQVKFLPITLRSKVYRYPSLGHSISSLTMIFKSLWGSGCRFLLDNQIMVDNLSHRNPNLLFLVHLTKQGTLFTLVIVILNIFSATHELVIGKIMLRQLQDEQLKNSEFLQSLCL